MIDRYSRQEMAAIWAQEAKFRIWLEIESHAADAMADLGVIPEEAARDLREKGAFEIGRIDEIERDVKHDVIAFLTNVAEHVGPNARFVHQGLTSSDVLDTCFAIQLARAKRIFEDGQCSIRHIFALWRKYSENMANAQAIRFGRRSCLPQPPQQPKSLTTLPLFPCS